MDQYRVWGVYVCVYDIGSRPSTSEASASKASASRASTSGASASGASAIRERVKALNMDDDPLVDVDVDVDNHDDNADGNSRTYKIHGEVRPKKK
nr:myb/SANT-like domain, Harbinger transposase-derived nuclease domain protein [Tanacetum cinerariifolium]